MFATDARRDDGPVESFAVVTAEVDIPSSVGVSSRFARVLARIDHPNPSAGRVVELVVERMGGNGPTALDRAGDGS